MKDPKTPGDSDLFYELEGFASTRKLCDVVFLQGTGRSVISGRIDAVFVDDDVELLRMDSGLEIPLNQILQINSKVITGFA